MRQAAGPMSLLLPIAMLRAILLRALVLSGLMAAWMPWAFASGATASSPAVSQAASPVTTLEADLLAQRALVLVVIDGADRKLKASEAYGDWQSYLRSYVNRRRGELPVHQVSPEQARKLLPSWPRDLRNATLFVNVANAQRRGLLHRGLILEPQVYLIGKAFAEDGTESPEAASFGLEAFDWK